MIKLYQKTAITHAVQYDGTDASGEEIISFMREERGVLYDASEQEVGRRAAGWFDRRGRMFITGEMTEEQRATHADPLAGPDVLAVVWNDLHKQWNPVRVGDHVALDSQGCFYPIADADLTASYTEVGQK